ACKELRPRLCHMKKGPNGYGFNLHSDKSRPGQYVRAVDPDSPAEAAGLSPQDRIIEVRRGVVVAGGTKTRNEPFPGLLSFHLSPSTELSRGVSASARSATSPASSRSESLARGRGWARQQAPLTLRPHRLVGTSLWPRGRRAHMFPWDVPKSPYVPESPCLPQLSPPVHWGLCTALTQRRVPQVNGVCMEGKQHADVVAAIKAGGDETKLLVVDVLTDEFFKKCKVVPSEAHLAGPLPEPVANGDPAPREGEKRPSAPGSLLDLDIPLAVAKERAHQKRTSKRAPQMDWSKKNELFSNL
uniref:Na(+)/H(+) exchange regulatory cofactor NHE-RF1 n=1 Tax=Apteryx owenii TaxID=8824 RepID=A0A8B9SAX6_APTOW